MVFQRCQFWPFVKSLKVCFTGKNSIKLELALVRNSRPCHFAACFKILLSLAMFHSRVFSREILKFRKFSNCFQCKPCFKYLHLRFSGNILTRSTVGGLEILIQIILLSARSIVLGPAMFQSLLCGHGNRSFP